MYSKTHHYYPFKSGCMVLNALKAARTKALLLRAPYLVNQTRYMVRCLILALLLLFSFVSCKKIKENAQEKAVMNFITGSQWKIVIFARGDSTLSQDFEPYRFQFRDNLTVDALKNGTFEKRGTWDGNATEKTITANFTDAGRPLVLLNGVWKITDSGMDFVEATMNDIEGNRKLRMIKL